MKGVARVRIIASALLLVGLAAAISFAQSLDPKQEAAKLEPGLFYWTGSAWQMMEPVTWSANGVKKTGKLSVWIYRHAQARVQVASGKPLFCYKFIEASSGNAPSSPGFVIARVEQKKDYRQFQTASDLGAFAVQAGSGKGNMSEITVTDTSPGLLLISPKEPLSPGEYVLGGSSLAITGYDFGFHADHK
jgi:hypothetical protein